MNQARIGVVGYCPPTKYDEKKALKHLEEAFDKVLNIQKYFLVSKDPDL